MVALSGMPMWEPRMRFQGMFISLALLSHVIINCKEILTVLVSEFRRIYRFPANRWMNNEDLNKKMSTKLWLFWFQSYNFRIVRDLHLEFVLFLGNELFILSIKGEKKELMKRKVFDWAILGNVKQVYNKPQNR